MHHHRTYKLMLLAGAATLLQGCIAAVVPIAAGGLFTASSGGRESESEIMPPPLVEAAPAINPQITVQMSNERAALAATPAVAEPAPGLVEIALPEPAPEPALEPAPEPAALALPQTQPETYGPQEPPAQLAVVIDPAPTQIVTPSPIARPDPVPEPQPAPAQIVAAAPEPAPLPAAAPRIIAVDSQVALAEPSARTPTVSAAQAAAALTALETEPEPEATGSLARVRPEPAPAAVSAATSPPAALAAPAAPAVIPPPPAPPSATPAATSRTARPLATGEFAPLINYANRQSSRSAENRASAVLADRTSLMPERAACGGAEPTVLIDLDPDGDTFDPTNVTRAAPGLSSALAQLRASGVKIAWITKNPANQVVAIRNALNRSGLDLDNSDQVLLMRYPEDRKQTRREDLAASSCLIAIAGDVRSDFDELFEYLINPEAAAMLDPLIGNGWFVIPAPVVTERPNP